MIIFQLKQSPLQQDLSVMSQATSIKSAHLAGGKITLDKSVVYR